jgi:dipeptidyl-peptidase-4
LAAVLPLATSQDGSLTLEAIYHPDPQRRIEFSGKPIRGLRWLDDASYIQQAEEGREDQATILRVDARNGSARPLFDVARLKAALAALPGMSADDAAAFSDPKALQFNSSFSAALINRFNDLFFYEFESSKILRLTNDPTPEVGEEFSPDGTFVSFVRDHNLFVVEIATQKERPLTLGGNPELLYGRLDWVYQEEIYGRGKFKGYWWSPDSRRIALLKLDESPVREFTVVDHIPIELDTEVTNYPKAGSPNPKVWLGVIEVAGGDIRWADTRKYEAIEHLIVNVSWTKDSSSVCYQVQDREQTWLDLNLADASNGQARTLHRETSPAWVSVLGKPHWLADGGFLWLSEHSGHRHIYHHKPDGQLKLALTKGEWDVRVLYGVDEENGWVYFAGSLHSPLADHIYRIKLDGSDLKRLSTMEGDHDATFNDGMSLYFDRWSDVNTPHKVFLYGADGTLLRALDENPVPELAQLRLGLVEFLQVPTRDEFVMEAMLIKPPDFDPEHSYPVLYYQYSGPQAAVVHNSWGGSRYLWHHMLAQNGYVIWMCDNRSASNKGAQPAWEAYQRHGEVEMLDIEDSIAFLRQQPWVDPARIGIWGWSYGGFMAAYALTHSSSFKVGIAGAPVTDWRLYDTIYTERYMRMPQNNPEGYDRTSVVKAAPNLHGKLLLIHGTMDDNVHMQNTLQLAYELQKAGKDFELMLYPKSRHRVDQPELNYHMQRQMTDFVLENL